MSISFSPRTRAPRSSVVAEAKRSWWQLHRAAQAKEYGALVAGLRQLDRCRHSQALTLPEMLVASGSVR